MSDAAVLTMWNPRLVSGGTQVLVTLTPMEAVNGLSLSESLCRHVLTRLGLSSAPRSWSLMTFRSSYFGEGADAEDWSERWQKGWRLTMTLEPPAQELPARRHEYSDIFEGGVRLAPEDPGERVHCLVIADFEDEGSAQDALEALQDAPELKALAEGAPPLQVTRVSLGEDFSQLEIDLGEFPVSFFEQGARYAAAVEELCREHGALTSFDERANSWDELFDEDGLE